MEEQNAQPHDPLRNLAHAANALLESVESALDSEPVRGAAKMLLKGYNALHRRAAELLPDEYHITDGLALEIEEDATDHEILNQVRVAARQLRAYLHEMLPGEHFSFDTEEFHFHLPHFAEKMEGGARRFEARARKMEAKARKMEAKARKMEAKMEAKARKMETKAHKFEAFMERLGRKLEETLERNLGEKRKRREIHVEFDDPYDDAHDDFFHEIH